MDSELVRWSSTFHHVFVFTVKKRCVLFIDIVKFYLLDKNFLVQKYIFSCLPVNIRHSLILQSKQKFVLNNSAIWPVNTKPQNKQMHCQISPTRVCNPWSYAMKISSMYHRLLIYDVK